MVYLVIKTHKSVDGKVLDEDRIVYGTKSKAENSIKTQLLNYIQAYIDEISFKANENLLTFQNGETIQFIMEEHDVKM